MLYRRDSAVFSEFLVAGVRHAERSRADGVATREYMTLNHRVYG